MVRLLRFNNVLGSLLLLSLPARVFAGDVLQTTGFSSCGSDADIQVQKMNIKYDKSTQLVVFDVAGTSNKVQEVTASLVVTAYGQQVYEKSFDPCDAATKVEQLCPVPSGTFAATGTQAIPAQYANMVPAIAFSVPDLDGMAQLKLMAKNSSQPIACIQSSVGNGKSFTTPAVPGIAAGIAGGALIVSGLSALASGGHPGATASSPTFFDVMGWFQSMALNGMLSVNYPPLYRSFSKNFAFSGLLIPWHGMQVSIDNFRSKTGGNLTGASVEFLEQNTTFVYPNSNTTVTKRSVDLFHLFARQITTSTSNTTGITAAGNNTKVAKEVKGIEAFIEPLLIPKSNTFMTVLMVFAIVIAAIIVGILLFKVILELWALMGKFPQKLLNFRERYWWVMAKTITSLILLLYGVWTLYCVYQFTQGDSWAAKTLAGVTLALFTAVLVFFTWKIASLAHKYKKLEGDTSGLYDNEETWRNYSIFYENYKKQYWWLFIPAILYAFARGVVIAAGDGHGLFQVGGQLIIESIMLLLLLFLRPYSLKSGNWIGIVIQVVRVLSVLCILVFVEQIGIAAAPKSIVGVVLVAMQSILTGLLAILIAINGLVMLCKANPHRKARKQAEKDRESSLTPLDARNSLLERKSWGNKLDVESNPGRTYLTQDPYAHVRKVSDASSRYTGHSVMSTQPMLPNVALPDRYRGNF